jgi:hypothetical protein
MPAPPQKSSTGLIIAVVVIVAVVVVAVPLVLYVLVSGLGPGGTQPIPPTVVLQGGGSWRMSGNNATYTFTVTDLSPAPAVIDPDQLQYIASTSAGTVVYSGAADQHPTSAGFTINVHYNDALGVGRVSESDAIQVSVTPVSGNPLVGGSLRVNFNGDSLASGILG